MRVSLLKDPLSKSSEIFVHVEVSEIDDPLTYSHSFKYKAFSGMDKNGRAFGEVIIYTSKNTASGGNSFFFHLEECRNKDCKKEDCPVDKPTRPLVTNVFHTKPKGYAIQYFGTALFKALFSCHARQLLQKTEPPHLNSGIYLQLNKHADLDAIPWEYANDRTAFLVHQRIFVRVHNRPQNPLPNLPLRIITVIPDPINTDFADLHPSEQFRRFINGFTKIKKSVELERVFPPTLHQMDTQLMMESKAATVLHFIGHCGQKGVDSPRALIFEHNDNGKQEYIDSSRLVSTPDNLRLAFLSASNSRDIARVLVEHGVPYTIGSNCSIPDDLAHEFEFEFYKFLTGGSTVEMAMYQARTSIQIQDDSRQSGYFAGAIAFYSSKFGKDSNVFKCEDGDPDIRLHEPPHNLTEFPTVSKLRGGKKELSKLYTDLKRMTDRGTQATHIYTIKGVGGQEFVAEAMRRMVHLFPGGIFTWVFDKEITSVTDYFRRLVEVIFPKGFWKELTERHGSNNLELGSAIIRQFQTGNHATCLLILGHADILDLGRKAKNMHAERLGSWLEDVNSVRDSVKLLITSEEPLEWLKGGLLDLNGSSDLSIDNEGQGYTTNNMKRGIHKHFQYYRSRSQGLEGGNCFYDVPGENHAFVDRPIIQEMRDALKNNSISGGCNILALKGQGGMGKSQLMLRYCYLHHADYNFIFWLTVDNWNAAVYSYCQLAEYFGLEKEIIMQKDSEQRVIRWVIEWFEKNENWLLLLDNADDGEMSKEIFKLLPDKGGDIIFTTRQPISQTRAMVIPVGKMQEQEAMLLLYGVTSMDQIDQESTEFKCAQEIVTELDCMPLAINLAQAYIANTSASFKEYLIRYKEQKERVRLSQHDENNSLTTVWQVSFQQIRAQNPATVQILEACAFLHPENIPACLFKKQYSVLKLVDEQDNEKSIGEAIAVLVEFSFMTRTSREMGYDNEEDPVSDLLAIHPLVQKVIYGAMDDEHRLLWAHKTATAFEGEIASCKNYTPRTLKIMNAYLSHIRHFVALLHDLSEQPLMSKALDNVLDIITGHHLYYGIHFGVEELAQLSVRISEAVNGPEHSGTTTSLNNLARLYESQGKNNEAEPLYQKALDIKKKALGSEHPDTATSLNNLAELYQNQGKYDEAEPLYQRALAIHEEVLGSEHPETAASLNNLAKAYAHQDKFDEAEPLYQRALTIKEKVLGSEHPSNATVLDNMAVLYVCQGKYDKAEQLYQRALAISKKALGSEHPDTATALNNLAEHYVRESKCDEAEPLYKQALAIRMKVLGSEHPDTAQSLNNLAELYVRLGKYDEAEPLYKQALAIRERVLGPEHRDTATPVNNLAGLYVRQGKNDEAEMLYQRALAIHEKVLGSEHQDTATSLNNLAFLYARKRKYDEAEPLYKRALAIRMKVLGSDHPFTAATLRNLRSLSEYRGQ